MNTYTRTLRIRDEIEMPQKVNSVLSLSRGIIVNFCFLLYIFLYIPISLITQPFHNKKA